MTVGVAATQANAELSRYRNTAAAAIATVYVQLHTGDPGAAGTTAVSAGSTTRNTITFAAPSGGSMAMSAMGGTWTNGGTSETLSHISLWDASTAGNFLRSITLGASQAWVSTNTFTLTSCTLSQTPIAA
jgi:hypothetical protein